MRASVRTYLICLTLLGGATACVTAAPRTAPAPVAPGVRVRVWVAEPPRASWRTGWLLALTSDSLVIERTDVLGRPRLALPLGSVVRLESYRSGRRDRAAVTGCLAGAIAVGFLGATVVDPDSPGIGTRLAIAGAAYGCSVGVLVGVLVGEAGEWQPVQTPSTRAPP